MPDTPPSESHYSAGLSHSEGAGAIPQLDGTPGPAFGPSFHPTLPEARIRSLSATHHPGVVRS